MEFEQLVKPVELIGRSLDSNMKFSTKISILAISLGIFTVGTVFAVISNSDETKIRELISEYQIALNNEEIEKISTVYSKQAIFMPPEIPAINGVEEIVLTYEHLFSQFDFELEFDIKEVVISEDFAYVYSNSEGTIESSETEETSKNQEIFILIKEGNDWKISRYIFNSLQNQHSVMNSFEECIAAGNPAMESYPRQCITQDGKHFVEGIT